MRSVVDDPRDLALRRAIPPRPSQAGTAAG